MRALGIDPGFGRVGWGIVENNEFGLVCINYGCIETPPALEFPQRLDLIYANISTLIRKNRPDVAGVEILMWGKNVTNGMRVSMARGVILLAIAQAGLPLYEPYPSQVKAEIGAGDANKKQVQRMIKNLLGLSRLPRPDDAADALAVSLFAESRYRLDQLVLAA